ncbi:MAG: bifunctional metallophosphatase/5'-nucleotidase [Acidobacteria bacterium]|nr:MAG: bifunctional metallophosphatase/5'-nucleotidase [Acidobacteriota bacterium]MCE7957569.1 bifunctional metallophosphatase/5'-nucleotidase [Acidobacteria bacterium ACB2]
MKLARVFRALALLVLLPALPAVAADGIVTLLHVSDTHSHLDATGPRDAALRGTVGGIAKVTTVVGMARAEDPEALLLHAGDLFQGDLFFNVAFGVPELGWMKAMGFDAMTVGNHEFDLGPENLAGILATAFADGGIPLLSANASGLEAVGLAGFVAPSVLKTRGGVAVGIFGLTVPDEPLSQNAPVVLDPDVAGAAAREVAALRASGAELVVLLSHLGFARDVEVASSVEGVDVVVGGHDHLVLEEPLEVTGPGGRKAWVLQAGPHYARVGRLRVAVAGGQVSLASYELLPLDETVPPEPGVAQLVEGLRGMVEEAFPGVYSVAVGQARRDLPAVVSGPAPARDSPVGNLVADAFRAKGHTQVALTTAGFLSEGIARGPIVPADLFRVVSYGYDPDTGMGFPLATFRISGAEMVKALEIALAGPGPTDPFFPQVSGLSFAYNSSRAPGARLLLPSLRVDGAPLEPMKRYTVTANAALVSFLPLLGVSVEAVAPIPDAFEYTALLRHVLRLGGVVDPRSEGRVRDQAPPPVGQTASR